MNNQRINELLNEINNLVCHLRDIIGREVDGGACSAPPTKAVPDHVVVNGWKMHPDMAKAVQDYRNQVAERNRLIAEVSEQMVSEGYRRALMTDTPKKGKPRMAP